MIKVAFDDGVIEYFDGNVVSTAVTSGALIIIKGEQAVAEVAPNKWRWYKVERTNA